MHESDDELIATTGCRNDSHSRALKWMPVLELVRSPVDQRQQRGTPPLKLGEEKDARSFYRDASKCGSDVGAASAANDSCLPLSRRRSILEDAING